MSEFLKPVKPEHLARAGKVHLDSPLHPIVNAFMQSRAKIMEVDTGKVMAKFPGHYKRVGLLQASFVSIVKTRQLPILVKSVNYGERVFLLKKDKSKEVI